jgi:hypothetical protein
VPHERSEFRRRQAERAAERVREVAVARESRLERQRREVVRRGQTIERVLQAETDDVPVQRDAFDAAKEIGEVNGRCADRFADVGEADRFREVRGKIFFRANEQLPGFRPDGPRPVGDGTAHEYLRRT